jgi:hypothetical protein
MDEKNKGENEVIRTVALSQNVLFWGMISLLILLLIFSLLSLQNLGREGYDRCISEKCEKGGDAYCSKAREISNCCEGAGGELGVVNGKYDCVFN